MLARAARTSRAFAQQRRMFSAHGHGHGEPEVFNPKDLVLPGAFVFSLLFAVKLYISSAITEARVLDAEMREMRSNGAFEREDKVLAVFKQ